MISGGTVNAPIGRHPTKRTLMAIVENGKSATTHYRIIERFRAHTHLKVQLETGRTHQIRIHMTHIQHPIVGDSTYGGRIKLPKGASAELIETLRQFKHPALHARRLTLTHPSKLESMTFNADTPIDFQNLASMLHIDTQEH